MHKFNCILLIDDDQVNNYLNERLIKQLNITNELRVTRNGQEGLEFIKNYCEEHDDECPELIFLDINMPVMDGFEFLEVFANLPLKNKEKISLNILTSSTNNKDVATLSALGNFHFIQKPLTEEKLFNCLTMAMAEV